MKEQWVCELQLLDDKKFVRTRCYEFRFDEMLDLDDREVLFVRDHKIIVKADKRYYILENLHKESYK